MKKAALVVMAAGMGSRYGGSKQTDGMGPNGETLMEYSVRDAIRAGFTKVVFVIRPEMLEKMGEICGNRFSGEIDVRYACQDFSSIPPEYTVPAERVKPFGTVHAVLCAAEHIDEPFAVINADDFYGAEAFVKMHEFLTGCDGCACAAMLGYKLRNTVSRFGAVTRALCRVENGYLVGARELKKIQLNPDGVIAEVSDPDAPEVLDPDSPVSMNFWGFGRDVFRIMDAEFRKFLLNIEEGDLRAEYLLPVFVNQMICADRLRVNALNTDSKWFGVTYQEDKPRVAAALKALHEAGLY